MKTMFSVVVSWLGVFLCVHATSVHRTEETLTLDQTNDRVRRSSDDFWTSWYDVDDPNTGDGDYEITSELGRNICPQTHSIKKAQCDIVGGDADDDDAIGDDDDDDGDGDYGDVVKADNLTLSCTRDGIVCRNSQQYSGMCHDYKIRFYCQLDEEVQRNTSRRKRRSSSFDMRIYIILAAVPVTIFLFRIVWSCTFDRRRRRRIARLRQLTRSGRGTSEVGVDPAVFMPPPSYQELFGVGGLPYSLSRQYYLCRKCKSSQCELFRNRQSPSLQLDASSHQSSEHGDDVIEMDTLESPTMESETISRDASPTTSTSSSSSSSSPTSSPLPLTSSSFSSSSSSSSSSSPSSSRSLSMSSESQNSENWNSLERGHVSDSENSGSSELQVNSQTVEQSQCDCPCHKQSISITTFDNPVFSPDVDIQDGRTSVLPGMHFPVCALFRSASTLSMEECPPPSYTEALQILKNTKNTQC